MLDATFDHVLPLAIPRMPAALESVVRVAIHDNVNLAVADQGGDSIEKLPFQIWLENHSSFGLRFPTIRKSS